MKTYSRHKCDGRHRTPRTFIECAIPRDAWVKGDGPYALIAVVPGTDRMAAHRRRRRSGEARWPRSVRLTVPAATRSRVPRPVRSQLAVTQPDDLDPLRQQLRHTLDDLDITRRATLAHDRQVLDSFDTIRQSVAKTLTVSRDALVTALARVDDALIALAAARLNAHRAEPDEENDGHVLDDRPSPGVRRLLDAAT